MSKPTLVLIGAGAAGTSLALALMQAGYPVKAVVSRRLASAQRAASLLRCELALDNPETAGALADILIIATPDGQIAKLARDIAHAENLRDGTLVLHLSGALPSSELAPLGEQGADLLALHPIQSMAEPVNGARLLRGSYFSLEGSSSGVARGRELVKDLDGHALVISAEDKPLYHAALSVCSNYLVALESIAAEMLEATGIPQQAALQAMLPLIQGSVSNMADKGLANSLTGPISRGDLGTVEKHLQIIESRLPGQSLFYRLLGERTAQLAEEKGSINERQRRAIEKLLSL